MTGQEDDAVSRTSLKLVQKIYLIIGSFPDTLNLTVLLDLVADIIQNLSECDPSFQIHRFVIKKALHLCVI